MGLALVLTYILSTCIAKGYSLSCIQCVGVEGPSCSGISTSKRCPSSDDVCVSSYTVTEMGGMEVSKQFVRHCESKKMCDKAGSISIPNGRVKMSNVCCRSDNCDPGLPKLPLEKTLKNGIMCDGCIGINTKSCHSNEPLECVGDEKMCISYLMTMSGVISTSMALRGCATENFCVIGEQEVENEHMKLEVDISCGVDGAISLQLNQFLLALPTLLLLKYIS
ncbi:phospholipase A2 inhibitor and Ly6/PLAUR domain-containing protein-like [Xenopus laevis]|uniref:Phospholipase A2 inhibitor and Ly6/PLAUR domain-containing protein-like n=1 Tax=Xenopus laevis TaxID=8355 RepID=A0A8J1LDN8_XENLA|nr:phospholipase A2 inhibitor and Ly6/PLAUR domain-containing protein-like [Xenopus laevis]